MKQLTMTFNVEDDFEPGCCFVCPLHYTEWSWNEDDGTDCYDRCVLCADWEDCPIKKEDIRED